MCNYLLWHFVLSGEGDWLSETMHNLMKFCIVAAQLMWFIKKIYKYESDDTYDENICVCLEMVSW